MTITLEVQTHNVCEIPMGEITPVENACEPATYTITDDEGNVLYSGTILSGGSLTKVIQDSTVENSDASYSVSVNAEGSLVLPDSQVNVNLVNEGDVVSVKTIDINVTDGVDPVTPDSVTITGNTIEIQVTAGGTPTSVLKSSTLMKTGQTTSYRTGDDGDFEAGRATDFFTLNTIPVHADGTATANTTTNRFTDELGGQTYTNDIVIDWSTYDNVAETVLGYRRTTNGSNITWADAIDEALTVSVGSYTTGWRLPNITEIYNLMNYGLSGGSLSYSPINIGNNALWTSTTAPNNTTAAYYRNGFAFSSVVKTASGNLRYIPCRTFTVSGTSLT